MSEELLNIYRSRGFQIFLDGCRIFMLVVAILIFYKLVTEIEAVKILNSDPCRVCENKTGAVCFFPDERIIRTPTYSDINITKKLLNISE